MTNKIQIKWDNNDDVISFIGKELFDKKYTYVCIDMNEDYRDYKSPYSGSIGLLYTDDNGIQYLIPEGSYIEKDIDGNIEYK